jgi:two-component system, sensor histidine kinase
MLPALSRLQARFAAIPDDEQTQALQTQVWVERARMLSAHVPTVTAAGVVFALTLFVLLQGQVDPIKLGVWFGLRLLIVVPRLLHARRYVHTDRPGQNAWYRSLLALVFIDGLVWGAAWWWLVPIDHVDLTAITLTAILGVASLSAFILHADVRTMAWHVLPMLLPNALYSLTRHDAHGLFGAVSLAIFTVLLMLETRRAQARLVELLTLRFTHERVLHEREEALAMAQHHSEAKSRFLASMSHELRTPLHGILGLARLLNEDEVSPAKQRRLTLMERSGEHLLTVINDVLDGSKIEAGHVRIDSRPFDLAQLLDGVVGVSTVTANRKGLQLHVHTNLAASHGVVGDAMRVRQILHNLLGNATKFTEHGSVTLSVHRRPGAEHVTFTVQDTGVGIPLAEQAHIFEAFHQVAHAPDQCLGGTGLGLTIARQLSLAMGGDLRCTSQLGQGATFECTLCLPERAVEGVTVQGAVQASVAVNASTQLSSGKVLLVDDNPVNAMVAEAALRQLGVQVHIVDDGRKAVDWLADNRADLVLMDCQMPVMDGVEAARQIREQEGRMAFSPVPIIALTANNFPTERERCLNAGMNDYLGKPFRREELHHIIRKYLAFAGATASLVP